MTQSAFSRRALLTSIAALSASQLAASCSDGASHRATASHAPVSGAERGGSSSTAAPTTTPSTARFVTSGPTGGNRVALTFHTDGNLGLAGQLLEALSAARLRVTCFVVGSWLQQNPSWARRLLDAGHELANHTQHHLSFPKLPPAQMEAEVAECRDLLQRLTGSPGAFFRPSGTADGTARPSDAVLDVAARNGYLTVLGFDVDPFDYRDPGAAVVAARCLAGARPGSVLSLHFGHPGTISAIPRIADGLRARDLTPGTASELLS